MESNAVLRLTEIDGGGNASELAVIEASDAVVTLGRSHDADICFGQDDQSVSRQQFEISFSNGVPTLKNLARNPALYKNGKKQLPSKAELSIESGLDFTFRDCRLHFDVEVPEVYGLKTTGANGRVDFVVEEGKKYTVGRSPECDITLDSSGVSRRHCRIQIEADEVLKVHDLGSVNGVRLFTDGEVQKESPDIEVACGVKFIIGDIECILEKSGQSSRKKRVVAVPVILLLALAVAGGAYFLLKPVNPEKQSVETPSVPPEKRELPKEQAQLVRAVVGGNEERPPEKSVQELEQERLASAAIERRRHAEQIQTIIRAATSSGEKAQRFTQLTEESPLKSLRPVYRQMADYYGQCRAVERLIASAAEKYKQQKTTTRKAIQQMSFDFDSSLSFKKLASETVALRTSHQTVFDLLKEEGLEPPEFPRELNEQSDALVEKADIYGEKARSLLFIWTDLENSSFDASKFDRQVMAASIDTLYPDEEIGVDVCATIDEIINYQEKMETAYQGLTDQLRGAAAQCRENGVSEELAAKRLDMKPLREMLQTPLPAYFQAPPPITEVSKNLYGFLEGVSAKKTNLEFLTYCGALQTELEQEKDAFDEMDEVLLLIRQLCVEAAAQSAADLDEGLGPYGKIKEHQKSGEALGFNDANKLIQVYDVCHEYLQNDLFCKLQSEHKEKASAVSIDCLDLLYKRLRKECDDAYWAPLNSEQRGISIQNARRIFEILDSAVDLPSELSVKIENDRKWVEDMASGNGK